MEFDKLVVSFLVGVPVSSSSSPSRPMVMTTGSPPESRISRETSAHSRVSSPLMVKMISLAWSPAVEAAEFSLTAPISVPDLGVGRPAIENIKK